MGRFGRIRILCLATVCCFLIASPLLAGSIRLEWDRVPGATGYRVYYGITSGEYTDSVDVGLRTRATLQGLSNCRTWYVALKPYNSVGESAEYSNEVSGWPSPEVHYLSPSASEQGSQIAVEVVGANFQGGASASVSDYSAPADINGIPLIRLESAEVLSCTRMQAFLTVEPTVRGLRAAPVNRHSTGIVVSASDSVRGGGPVNLDVLFDINRWDINREGTAGEGRVDGLDLSWLAYAYGSLEGEELYNPDADLDGDGMVDGTDLAYLAAGFGLCWSGSSWTAEACL
jgi:hypothetical protein